MDPVKLRALERSSYYSVVRALYACGRLETFENEMLLTDLAESLNISEQDRLQFLLQVGQDAEVVHLKSFGAEAAPAAAAAAAVAGASMPVIESHMPSHAPALRTIAPPQPISIPQYQTPFVHTAVSVPASTKSESKKGAGAGMAPPGVSKPTIKSKPKSGASTPSTPRSQHTKAAPKVTEKKLVGAAAAAQQNAQQRAAQQEWDRLTAREREIFEQLLSLGVKEDDPELNVVHRNLLHWYRLDAREKQIVSELHRTDMIMV